MDKFDIFGAYIVGQEDLLDVDREKLAECLDLENQESLEMFIINKFDNANSSHDEFDTNNFNNVRIFKTKFGFVTNDRNIANRIARELYRDPKFRYAEKSNKVFFVEMTDEVSALYFMDTRDGIFCLTDNTILDNITVDVVDWVKEKCSNGEFKTVAMKDSGTMEKEDVSYLWLKRYCKYSFDEISEFIFEKSNLVGFNTLNVSVGVANYVYLENSYDDASVGQDDRGSIDDSSIDGDYVSVEN